MSRSQGNGMARHTVDAPHQDAAAKRRKPAPAPAPDDAAVPAPPSNLALGGTPLDPAVRADMEARFGQSFGEVRIHDDERAHRSAADLGAKAYTHGSEVAFAEGRYAPHTPDGRRLLAHELAHVVQQRRGGPAPVPGPDASHEVAADRAAADLVGGSGPVGVAGATAVGVAREPEDKKKKRKEEERKDASGPVRRVGPKAPKIRTSPKPLEIRNLSEALGVLGEVTVPFDVYSGPDWDHLGAGELTESSRLNIGRKTGPWGKKGGLDNLLKHRRTKRLVIGEQKRLARGSFTNATATTANLEQNLTHTAKQLRANLKNVHPDEVANVEDVIARLEQTARAVKNQTSLPEEVVFELTASGGKSSKIGVDYVRALGKKYKPAFVEQLLDRTFIRHAKPVKGKDPAGAVGTDQDPHLVRARDAMTPEAKSELERLWAGKTPEEWKAQKKQEKAAKAEDARRAKEAEKAKRGAEREKLKAEARKHGEETRQKKLDELRETAKKSGANEPETKAGKRTADNQLKKRATQAGKDAQKKYLEKARAEARANAQPKPKPAPEPAAPVDAAKPAAPVEAPRPAAPVEAGEPPLALELGPKGITPKGVVKGALGVAGALAAVAGVKDILTDLKERHFLSAAGKSTLLGLSFVGEAAPPLFAFGAIMNYWGPRHEAIEKDSFKVGDKFAAAAGHVPVLGGSKTFRSVVGAVGASGAAVTESIYYTGKDMVHAVGEGAEIVGGAVEDAWDWLTDGPSMSDLIREELDRRRREEQ
jgi:hypothetical protein